MISNESSAFGHLRRPPRRHAKPHGYSQEQTIRSEKIQIERKTFLVALKENPRGRFLRITEDVGGRRETIIVPAPGLHEFRRVMDDLISVCNQLPPLESDIPKIQEDIQD